MAHEVVEECHHGEGRLDLHVVMAGGDSDAGVLFMHDDVLEPGATIGEHPHEGMEEVYFVVDGSGTLVVDGQEYPMGSGDVSICRSGHTHGLRNGPDTPMRLIVFAVET